MNSFEKACFLAGWVEKHTKGPKSRISANVTAFQILNKCRSAKELDYYYKIAKERHPS